MTEIQFAATGSPMRAGKIVCLGRNYIEHAKEMKADVPTTPVLFLKPASALIPDGGTILIPSISNDVHHEVEMVPVEVAYEALRVVETVFVEIVGSCRAEKEVKLHTPLIYIHYKGMVERIGLEERDTYN